MCNSERSPMILMSRIPLGSDGGCSSESLPSDVANWDCNPSFRTFCNLNCDSSRARWCSHSTYLLCSDLRSPRNSLMISSLLRSAASSSVSSRLILKDIAFLMDDSDWSHPASQHGVNMCGHWHSRQLRLLALRSSLRSPFPVWVDWCERSHQHLHAPWLRLHDSSVRRIQISTVHI